MNKQEMSRLNIVRCTVLLSVIVVLSACSNTRVANNENKSVISEVQKEHVFELIEVEVQPQFIGGESELAKYLLSNTMFPFKAAVSGVSGKSTAKFIVDKTGKIRDVKILKSLDPYCDLETVRVIGKMPDWTPAQVKGEPVSCYFILPINFKNLGIIR